MSQEPKHTSKALVAFSLLLCLGTGAIVTQPSASSMITTEEVTAIWEGASETIPTEAARASEAASTAVKKEDPATEAADMDSMQSETAEAPVTVEPASSPTSSRYVSPEASLGSWTTANGDWFFMVDGKAYTGFLHDYDGHVYYFYEDGRMLTSFQNIDGFTYYFDADGIMQTGPVEYEGQVYVFGEDGRLLP